MRIEIASEQYQISVGYFVTEYFLFGLKSTKMFLIL